MNDQPSTIPASVGVSTGPQVPEEFIDVVMAALSHGFDQVHAHFESHRDDEGPSMNHGWRAVFIRRNEQALHYLKETSLGHQYDPITNLSMECDPTYGTTFYAWVAEKSNEQGHLETMTRDQAMAWITAPCPWLGSPTEDEQKLLGQDRELVTQALNNGWTVTRELRRWEHIFYGDLLDVDPEDTTAQILGGLLASWQFIAHNRHYNETGHPQCRNDEPSELSGDDFERSEPNGTIELSNMMTLSRRHALTTTTWETGFDSAVDIDYRPQPVRGSCSPEMVLAKLAVPAPWYAPIEPLTRDEDDD
jgi:hypothetical protein